MQYSPAFTWSNNKTNDVLNVNWDDCLTHFQSMFHFCTAWKHEKIFGFLMFSGGIEVEH